jgi:hypothetical protein
MVCDGDGVVDEVQGFTKKTTAWSACSIGSCCEGDGQLEAAQATVTFGLLGLLRVRTIRGHQGMRVIKGEMRGAKSGGGVTVLRRISTEIVAHSFNSGEKSGQPGSVIWRGEKGEMERRMRGLIGMVRRRNGSGINRY